MRVEIVFHLVIRKKIKNVSIFIYKRAKPIDIYDINKNIIKECKTTTEAYRFSGLINKEFRKLLESGEPSKKGYIFKYKDV